MKLLIAAAAGIVTFLALFPFSGADTQPPVHYGVFGNRVPTGNPWLAVVCMIAVAALVLVVRRRRPDNRGL